MSKLLLAALASSALSGCALYRVVVPEHANNLIDFFTPAMVMMPRLGDCAPGTARDRGGRMVRFRCTKAIILRHDPVQGRDVTIFLWGVGNSVMSVAGTRVGDTVRISVAQPDNDHPVRATGICRLYPGPPQAPQVAPRIGMNPELEKRAAGYGEDPIGTAARIECEANRVADGKPVIRFVFITTPDPPKPAPPTADDPQRQ